MVAGTDTIKVMERREGATVRGQQQKLEGRSSGRATPRVLKPLAV